MSTKDVVAFAEELEAAMQALSRLQDKFAQAPKEDWQASLAWEGVEIVTGNLQFEVWYAINAPYKPDDFSHWRDKYATEM
jgi:hypothetical protein